MKISHIVKEGVGIIVPGVNTTPDVGVGQTEIEGKKFFGGNGTPLPLSGSFSKQHISLKESADPIDTVEMDVPLLIRALEYAREDAKNDMELHSVVQRMIAMAKSGVITMDNYDEIFSTISEDFGVSDNWGVGKHVKRMINMFKSPDNYKLANRIMKDIIEKNSDMDLKLAAQKTASMFDANDININWRRLLDRYEALNELRERRLTGGEKRSRESNVKKLKKHKDDFENRYGKDAESVMYAVATKRAKGD